MGVKHIDGEDIIQPLTAETVRTLSEEEQRLATETFAKWTLPESAEEQIKLNEETIEKIRTWMGEQPFFEFKFNEDREAIRTFTETRLEKEEALRVALMVEDFNAEKITAAADAADTAIVTNTNPALIERAKKRVLLSQQIADVKEEVESFNTLAESIAQAKVSLQELETRAQEAEAAHAEAQAEAEEPVQYEPDAELEDKIQTGHLEVADLEKQKSEQAEKILKQHGESVALLELLTKDEVPIAESEKELEEVLDAVKEPEMEENA